MLQEHEEIHPVTRDGASPVAPHSTTPGERLDSWKEIAAFLGRGVRTVQRWEEVEGLPVHRHVHGRGGTVFAYKSELQGWAARRESSPQLATVPALVTANLRVGDAFDIIRPVACCRR